MEIAALEQAGDLVGIDTVVLGLVFVDELHVQRVADDKGNVVFGAAVGEPVPAKHALDADDDAVAVRCDDLLKFSSKSLFLLPDRLKLPQSEVTAISQHERSRHRLREGESKHPEWSLETIVSRTIAIAAEFDGPWPATRGIDALYPIVVFPQRRQLSQRNQLSGRLFEKGRTKRIFLAPAPLEVPMHHERCDRLPHRRRLEQVVVKMLGLPETD